MEGLDSFESSSNTFKRVRNEMVDREFTFERMVSSALSACQYSTNQVPVDHYLERTLMVSLSSLRTHGGEAAMRVCVCAGVCGCVGGCVWMCVVWWWWGGLPASQVTFYKHRHCIIGIIGIRGNVIVRHTPLRSKHTSDVHVSGGRTLHL